jgi:hypothetical protein
MGLKNIAGVGLTIIAGEGIEQYSWGWDLKI